MKTMTCNQLGGACDLEFHAETFEEMGKLSREHGTKMFEKGDEAHLKAMEKMKPLMKDPKAMEAWLKGKRDDFDQLEED